MRLERRLEQSAIALTRTVPALAALTARERFDQKNFTPEGQPVKPVLIVTAQDIGRVKITPIRLLRLVLMVRANSKTAGGEADAIDALAGAIETLLDGTNLRAALTSAAHELHVFVAVRASGTTIRRAEFIREYSYAVDVKCVGAEHAR